MKSKVIEKVNNLKLVAEINNEFANYQLAQPFFMANLLVAFVLSVGKGGFSS